MNQTLTRFDYRARLDNLVKSASLYKTKACGVMRNRNSNSLGKSSSINAVVGGGYAPTSRVIIEQLNHSQFSPGSTSLSTHRSFQRRRNSNSSCKNGSSLMAPTASSCNRKKSTERQLKYTNDYLRNSNSFFNNNHPQNQPTFYHQTVTSMHSNLSMNSNNISE
jgi:hypothetical protein